MSAYFEGSAFISVGGGLVIHASAASFCFWNMLDPIPASRWCEVKFCNNSQELFKLPTF